MPQFKPPRTRDFVYFPCVEGRSFCVRHQYSTTGGTNFYSYADFLELNTYTGCIHDSCQIYLSNFEKKKRKGCILYMSILEIFWVQFML